MIEKDTWLSIVKPVSQGGLLGAPYEWCGRGPNNFDCWGLIVEIRSRIGQPIIDEWSNIEYSPNISHVAVSNGFNLSCWVKTEEFEPGNIIGLGKNKMLHHTGIVTPWGIMHTVKVFGALIHKVNELKLNGYNLIQPYSYIGHLNG